MRPAIISLVLFTLTTLAHAQETDWRWVVGKLSNAKAQREYRAFAQRMFDYYQKRNAMVGELVEEAKFDASKRDRVVFLGPFEAFEHPDRIGIPALAIRDDGSLRLGNITLNRARVGLFLRNAEQTRFLYTGMTPQGFRDIFGVPTGRHACTITENRKAKFQGDYRGGRLRFAGQPGEGFSLQELPNAERIRAAKLPNGLVSAAPVYANDGTLAAGFSRRIASLTEKNNVLFVGESHWNVGVSELFNTVLRELLRTRDVRAVFLELNYSYSAFYDHYVTLDDKAAATFLKHTLHPLVNARTTLETLDIVRRHNLTGAKPRVRMACLDLEWSPGAVMRLLADAKRGRKYPFVTDDYLAHVETNMRDTEGRGDFHPRRQRAIIRNITEWHGDLLGEGLAVFKGGGFHAVKREVEGEDFDRDAEYLHNTHPTTKGQVATMWIQGLGYGFRDVADVDLRDRLASATNYTNFVTSFQKGVKSGTARTDGFYLLDGKLGPVDAALARSALDLDTNAVWIEKHDPVKVRDRHRCTDYDLTAVIIRAQLEPTRPRRPK